MISKPAPNKKGDGTLFDLAAGQPESFPTIQMVLDAAGSEVRA